MFTVNQVIRVDGDASLIEASCMAADSKPTTGLINGSLCIEMDTGKIYAFNEAGSAWVEIQ